MWEIAHPSIDAEYLYGPHGLFYAVRNSVNGVCWYEKDVCKKKISEGKVHAESGISCPFK